MSALKFRNLVGIPKYFFNCIHKNSTWQKGNTNYTARTLLTSPSKWGTCYVCNTAGLGLLAFCFHRHSPEGSFSPYSHLLKIKFTLKAFSRWRCCPSLVGRWRRLKDAGNRHFLQFSFQSLSPSSHVVPSLSRHRRLPSCFQTLFA